MDHFERMVKTWDWFPPWTKGVAWHFRFQTGMQWECQLLKGSFRMAPSEYLFSESQTFLCRIQNKDRYLKSSHVSEQQVIWIKLINPASLNEFRSLISCLSPKSLFIMDSLFSDTIYQRMQNILQCTCKVKHNACVYKESNSSCNTSLTKILIVSLNWRLSIS